MRKLTDIAANRRTWAWPYVLFMVLFVVLPLIMIVYYAFTDAEGGFTLYNFIKFFHTSEAINTLIYSFAIALITTIICLLLGYPAAYIMANAEFKTPAVMAMLFILPMWINFLLRTIATVELFNMFGLPLGEGALAAYAIRLKVALRRGMISTDAGNAAFDRLTAKTKVTF